MKQLFKHTSPFIITWLFFLLIGIFFIFLFPKGEENILLNGLHTTFLDNFFYFTTFIGDGVFCTAMVLFFLFFSYKKTIWLAISFTSSALVTQVLKIIFNTPRPKNFLPDFNLLHHVADVTIHTTKSFPSGHATTAFTLAFCLSFFFKKSSYAVFFCLVAVTTAVSRIYLLQHFLIDILIGSVVGIVISFITCTLLEKSSLTKKKWINYSLIKKQNG